MEEAMEAAGEMLKKGEAAAAQAGDFLSSLFQKSPFAAAGDGKPAAAAPPAAKAAPAPEPAPAPAEASEPEAETATADPAAPAAADSAAQDNVQEARAW